MYPTLVYKGKGSHQRKNGGFSYLPVKNEDELQKALADSWFSSLNDAIDAHDSPKVAEAEVKEKIKADVDDECIVTRKELEDQAKKLGLSYRKNVTKEKLLALIEDEMTKPAAEEAEFVEGVSAE